MPEFRSPLDIDGDSDDFDREKPEFYTLFSKKYGGYLCPYAGRFGTGGARGGGSPTSLRNAVRPRDGLMEMLDWLLKHTTEFIAGVGGWAKRAV